ncbi:hypothetical protein FGRA07_10559 [Fusarium graminearum]|nr:hypothetical protein FGRA07_10559 [Fusarium graminearum]
MADLNILDIAQLGANLSSSLDLQAETCRKSRTKGIPKLLSLVNSTSSTLRKLHELSHQAPDAFTEVCINDINGLATKCRVLYEGILVLLVNRDEQHDENKEIGRMNNEQVESLLSSLTNKSFSNYKIWEWLDPRLKICQQELQQVKYELMMRVLLGSIAQFQLSTNTRSHGDWERERSMRLSAENMAKRRGTYHKKFKEKRDRWTKKDTPSSSARTSTEEKRSVTTDSSSVTAAPTSVQDKAIPDEDKSRDVGKDVSSKVSNVSDTINPTPDDEEENTTKSSDTTSYLCAAPKTWFQRLFSRKSCDEWCYEDIEAYTLHIRNGRQHVAKLPLEEKEIIPTLRKLTTKNFWNKRTSVMEQYASFDQTVRQDIDKAISTARRKSVREMTLIALSARKTVSSAGIDNRVSYTSEMSITIFFKLGELYAPIWIIDTNNEKWGIPYTSCETVKMLRDLIPTIGRFPIMMPPGMSSGKYCIYTEDRITVTPETWDSIRRPGMILRLTTMGYCPPPPWCVPFGRPPAVGPPPPMPALPKRSTMGDIYQEINDLLKLSDSWAPDEETLKPTGLGNLFRLWTNAVDPEAEDCSDSDWSYYSGTDSCSSTDIAD